MTGKKLWFFWGLSLLFLSGYGQEIWLYLPHHNAITGDRRMTFEWRRKSPAATYTLQISTDSLFGSPSDFLTPETRLTVGGLDYGQTYWWRVLGSGGEQSAARKFEVVDLKAIGPLSLWLRADSAVTADSTGLVSVWTDLSDSARTATQPGMFLMPSFIASSFNNLPAVRFGKNGGSGQQTSMVFPNLELNTPICVFSVHRILSNGIVLQYLLGNSHVGIFLGGTLAGNNNSGLFDGTNVLGATGPVFLNLNQTTWRKTGIRRNGTALTTTGAVGNFSVNTLGFRPDVPSLFFHGLLPELLVYKSALADADRDKVERYLSSKYARPARLPADTLVCGPSLTLTLPGGTEEFSAILWSTGSTGPGITVTQDGTYWVRGTSRLGGYITTDTIRVTGILPNPVVSPSQNQIVCTERDSVTIRNLTANPNFSFLWSTGSTEDSIRVSSEGVYFLQATDAVSGCVLTSDTVRLIHKTLADFANPAACPGVNAPFTDLSVDLLGDTIVSWSWDFGDPTTTLDVSTDTNGVWVYGQSGTYPVYLRVEASDGCADSVIKTVSVKPSATPDFTWQGPCYRRPTQFFDQSVPENGTQVTGYDWNFGSGVFSSFVNPAVTFDTAGIYPVTLTIFTASGCQESITRQIPVNKGAVAAFSVDDTLCAQRPINVAEQSTGVNDVITQWVWRFGNNPPISGQNPDFAFQTAGNRVIRLTVTTSEGCTDSTQTNVWVTPSPTAAFALAAGGGNPPAAPQVTNNSAGAQNYTWLVDGVFFSSDQNPPFPAWSDTGVYVISLVTENEFGCTDSTARTFTVYTGERSLQITDAQCEKTGDFMKYRARILNKGVLEVNQILLSASVNYENSLQEIWTGSLMPGQELNYQFTGSPKIFGSDEFCCVKIEKYNDTLTVTPPDNRLCRALDNGPWFSLPYPNPTDGTFTLDFILPFADKLSIHLSDAGGKELGYLLNNKSYGAGLHTLTHDLSELRSGMYFLKIFYRDRIFRVRVVRR